MFSLRILLLAIGVGALIARADAETLRGTVRDSKGAPIRGAQVVIATASPKAGRELFGRSCYIDSAKHATTNASGEYELRDLDPKLKFCLLSTANDKQGVLTRLLDPLVDSADVVLEDFPSNPRDNQLLTGAVVDVQGAPVSGAIVEPRGGKTPEQRWFGKTNLKPTVTDQSGIFRIFVGEPLQGVDLQITATGYAGIRATLLKPGRELHEITLPRGAAVTGVLTYQGQPMADQSVAVVQTNRSGESHFIKAIGAKTDRDGRFTIRGLPTSQEYAVFTPVGSGGDEGGLAVETSLFQVGAEGELQSIGELKLREGFRLSGRLAMHDGSKIPAGAKVSLGRDPAWDVIDVPLAEDGEFDVPNLPPEVYTVRVRAPRHRVRTVRFPFQFLSDLAFAVPLSETYSTVAIVLEPSTSMESEDSTWSPKVKVTGKTRDGKPATARDGVQLYGRILREGKPVVGMKVTVFRHGLSDDRKGGSIGAGVETGTSDNDGRFFIEGLSPGEAYNCELSTRPGEMAALWGFQMPYAQTVPAHARGVVELPDATLVGTLQTLRGQVVAPNGRPVSGARISATLAGGINIPISREKSNLSTRTSDDGLFSLSQLPNEQIEILAFLEDPDARFIKYPVRVRPPLNATNIRIVLDPSLIAPPKRIEAK